MKKVRLSFLRLLPPILTFLLTLGRKLDLQIARYVLSQPHWKDHPELAEKLIQRGKADEAIAWVLTLPHWKDHPE